MTDIEKHQIYDLRLKGVGYKAIAALLGMSRDCVRGYCKHKGLDGDARVVSQCGGEETTKSNMHLLCSKPIKQKGRERSRRFCSEECRRKLWNNKPQERTKKETATYRYTCLYCGKEFSCYGQKKRKYCSHNCYIKFGYWDEDDII